VLASPGKTQEKDSTAMMRSLYTKWVLAVAMLAGTLSTGRAADLEKFLPKETDVVISVNVRQLLDSALVKKNALDLIKTALATNKEAQQAIEALGLDPLTDFNRISIAMGLEDVSNPKAVVLIDGKFDVKKIDGVMDMLIKKEPKQFALDKVGGKTVYKITTPDQPTPMYAAALDASTMVFVTSKDMMTGAFEAAAGNGKTVAKKEVLDLWSKMDSKSSLAIVAQTKGRLDAIPLPDPAMKKIIEQVVSITAELKVEKDVNVELSIGTATADEAKQMRELVAGGLELAKVQVKVAVAQQAEMKPLVDLVNTMTAVQKDKSVVITGKVSGEALEKALNMK